MSDEKTCALPEGVLNPFFGKLLVGFAILFAVFNLLHVISGHTALTASLGDFYMGQIVSYLGTLLIVTVGLAGFHRTRSAYLKVGGMFLLVFGAMQLGLALYSAVYTP